MTDIRTKPATDEYRKNWDRIYYKSRLVQILRVKSNKKRAGVAQLEESLSCLVIK